MKKNNRVGEKHTTNQGYEIEIIEYFGCDNCTIKFTEGLILCGVQYGQIKRKSVENPYYPSVYGVGYTGMGVYSTNVDDRAIKSYRCWTGLIERGYEIKYKTKNPTYLNVTVCKEWHNFQNFAKWFEENYREGFDLDKDILVKGNKIYSPENCCFVPSKINCLITTKSHKIGCYPIGVSKSGGKFRALFTINNKTIHLGVFKTPEEAFLAYKTAKEVYIKVVADEWRPLIEPKVYQALYKWIVEITD